MTTPLRADDHQEREALGQLIRTAINRGNSVVDGQIVPWWEAAADALIAAGFRRVAPEPVRSGEPSADFSRGYDAGYSACMGEHPEWVTRAAPELREAWIAARHVVFAARAVVHAWEGDGDPNPLDDAMDKLRDIVTAYDQRNHDRPQPEPQPQQQGGEGKLRALLIEARDLLDDDADDEAPLAWVQMVRRIDAALAAPAPAAPAGVTEAIRMADEYLQAGGLFNPELMEHEKVRDLIIALRAAGLAAAGNGRA